MAGCRAKDGRHVQGAKDQDARKARLSYLISPMPDGRTCLLTLKKKAGTYLIRLLPFCSRKTE